MVYVLFFFFKQKTAYELRISDWSSDVCSSDLQDGVQRRVVGAQFHEPRADRAERFHQQFAQGRLERAEALARELCADGVGGPARQRLIDRKSTRLNSSH